MRENFYGYQRRRLALLLVWGVGSALVGIFMWRGKQVFWQQLGLQAVLWGAIDAGLAVFGLSSASKKEKRFAQGELVKEDELKEARGFWRILLINTGLDVGYVAMGVWVMRRFRERDERRGMGVGILVQGLWLLLFDGALSMEVGRRWIHR